MEHRHPYTARGVLTALGKSALYVLFFLGVQLLTGAIYAAIAIAGSALRPGGFDPQSILDGADTATLLADFFIAAGLLLWFKIRQTPLSEAVCLRRCSGWTVGFCSFAGIVLYVLTESGAVPPAGGVDGRVQRGYVRPGLHRPEHVPDHGGAGPLAEELTFRGVIQTRLERAMPPWLALVLQAAIFGLVHGTPIQMVYAFLMGLALRLPPPPHRQHPARLRRPRRLQRHERSAGTVRRHRRRRSRAGRHGGGGRGGLRGVPARACSALRTPGPRPPRPDPVTAHIRKKENGFRRSLYLCDFSVFCKKTLDTMQPAY